MEKKGGAALDYRRKTNLVIDYNVTDSTLLELDNITSPTTLIQVGSIGMYSIVIAPSLNETINVEVTIQWIIPQGFLFVPGLFTSAAGVLLIFFTNLVRLLKIPAGDFDGENA